MVLFYLSQINIGRRKTTKYLKKDKPKSRTRSTS